MAGPHDRNWAGAGCTKPGPEADPGYRAGYTPGKVEAFACMTRIFDGPATSLAGQSHAVSGARLTGAERRSP
jgi:hypothetical protein